MIRELQEAMRRENYMHWVGYNEGPHIDPEIETEMIRVQAIASMIEHTWPAEIRWSLAYGQYTKFTVERLYLSEDNAARKTTHYVRTYRAHDARV
jgi:hypothetical protein